MAKSEEEKAAEKAAREAEKRAGLLTELEAFSITDHSGTETIAPLTGNETLDDLAALLKQAKADAKAADKASKSGPVTVKFRDHAGEPTARIVIH